MSFMGSPIQKRCRQTGGGLKRGDEGARNVERLSAGAGSVQPEEKTKTRERSSCPLPLNECREEIARLFLQVRNERAEGSKYELRLGKF